MELNDSTEMEEPPLLAIGRQSYGLGSVENECQASSSNWPLRDCNGSHASSKNEFWHLENDAWRTFSGDLPQAGGMPVSHRAKRQHCWGATSQIPNNLDAQGPAPSRTHLDHETDFGQGSETELFGYCETTNSGTTGFDFFHTGLGVAGSSNSSLPPPSLMPGNGSRQATATGTGSWSAYAGLQTDLSPPIACFTGGDWKTTRDLMSNSVGQPAENTKGKSLDHLNTSASGGIGDGEYSDAFVFANPLLSLTEGEEGKPFFHSGGFASSSTDYAGNSRSDHAHGDIRGTYKRKISTVDFADAPALDSHFAARRERVTARTGGTGTNRSDPNGLSNFNATSNPSMIQIWDGSHNDCAGYVGNDNDYFKSQSDGSENTLIGTGEDASRSLQNQPFSMQQESSPSQLNSLFARNLRRTAHSHPLTRREHDVFGGNAANSIGALPNIDHWPAMTGERSSTPPVLTNWGVNSGSRRGNMAFPSSGSRERGSSNVVFEGSHVRSMPGRGPDWAAAAAMENRLASQQTSTSRGVAGPTGREMNPPDFSARSTSQAVNPFLNSGTLSSYLSASGANGHRVNRNPASPPPPSRVTSHQLPFGPPLEVPSPSGGLHAGRYALPSPSRGGRREALLAGPVQSVLGLPFRGLHMLRADGEYRRQFLSEILTAMHHAFRSEDLNIEEIVMLDPSIIYGGVDVHDEHSDMRLDVDNMSYEELLALEERIGNVSTGLDDEMISLCLRESKYSSLDATLAAISQESDVKCSICQEEFVEEDDLGMLDCGHGYHSVCIKQWLLQKNECPVCKSAAYLKSQGQDA